MVEGAVAFTDQFAYTLLHTNCLYRGASGGANFGPDEPGRLTGPRNVQFVMAATSAFIAGKATHQPPARQATHRARPLMVLPIPVLDRKLPSHSLTSAIKTLAELEGAIRPERAKKSDELRFCRHQTTGTGVSTELTVLFSAELRQGRSDQGSSPWSTQPRSLSRTPPSSRRMHRLPRRLGAES